jgi:hypothetical protein
MITIHNFKYRITPTKDGAFLLAKTLKVRSLSFTPRSKPKDPGRRWSILVGYRNAHSWSTVHTKPKPQELELRWDNEIGVGK